jgi:hypothetical protein
MVPGGRKELVNSPALSFGKSVPYLIIVLLLYVAHLPFTGCMVEALRALTLSIFAGVQSPSHG